MKGIIFDVDGTLWDSTREVAVAWNKVLQDEMEGHEILTAEGLQKEFGKPMDAIAESLFPEMPEKDRMELLGKMMAYENELVAVGPCVIYDRCVDRISQNLLSDTFCLEESSMTENSIDLYTFVFC